MLERALTLAVVRVCRARVGVLRLHGLRLRLGVVGLRVVVVGQRRWIVGCTAGHGPGVIAALNGVVPHSAIATAERVSIVAAATIGHTSIELATVHRIANESVVLTIALAIC